MKETLVISLGGSIIVPNTPDIPFLKNLKKLVKKNLKNYKFIFITGGGKTARNYINAASKVSQLKDQDLDWIGIHSTRLNGHLLRTIFEDCAFSQIIKDPRKKVKFNNVLIAAGWKPGFSTDYIAVQLAKTMKANTVINLTNIDYLYNKDPNKFKSAKKIENINWKDFRKIVGNKWSPGLNAPFDPIASKLAQKENMTLLLLGKNLNNLQKFLDKKKFKGSIVKS